MTFEIAPPTTRAPTIMNYLNHAMTVAIHSPCAAWTLTTGGMTLKNSTSAQCLLIIMGDLLLNKK
jgi:hypothetical protein